MCNPFKIPSIAPIDYSPLTKHPPHKLPLFRKWRKKKKPFSGRLTGAKGAERSCWPLSLFDSNCFNFRTRDSRIRGADTSRTEIWNKGPRGSERRWSLPRPGPLWPCSFPLESRLLPWQHRYETPKSPERRPLERREMGETRRLLSVISRPLVLSFFDPPPCLFTLSIRCSKKSIWPSCRLLVCSASLLPFLSLSLSRARAARCSVCVMHRHNERRVSARG